ncbi:MAG: tail fiber protein [Bacteroidales bacterium]|nr:tail fiber protein [Bacteroidales bacterium]MCF8392089.1 tail fiber protein [Bacteroidales bacterium]
MKKRLLLLLFAGLLAANTTKVFSQDAYLGDIKMTAITFEQSGWMECNGQLLPISQYSALFALLGTTYGGDGRTTFALPDLRGRVPIHLGNGPGLTSYRQGEKGGVEEVTLTSHHLPTHNHGISVNTGAGTTNEPNAAYLANTGNFDKEYATTSTATNTTMVQPAGGNAPIENRQPYVTVRYVICVQGIFPSRN